MGYRLSKIYTKTGDKGETGMADGSRVAKDEPKVAAIGDVDELNSQIGLLITEVANENTRDMLNRIQHILFDLGAELSLPDYPAVTSWQINLLEDFLDQLNESLKPLGEFILPGGCRSASLAHIARSVCRRAERSLVSLNRQQAVRDESLAFINRLSDLLFVIARQCCKEQGVDEVYWQKARTQQDKEK